MLVSDAMTTEVVTIGPSHSLRDASKVMSERKIGSVVVHDPEADGPGILTERDIVSAVAGGADLDAAAATDHLTTDSAYGSACLEPRRGHRCHETRRLPAPRGRRGQRAWWASSRCATSCGPGGTWKAEGYVEGYGYRLSPDSETRRSPGEPMSVTATYTVTGMTCGHCVQAVTDEITALEGVRAGRRRAVQRSRHRRQRRRR